MDKVSHANRASKDGTGNCQKGGELLRHISDVVEFTPLG